MKKIIIILSFLSIIYVCLNSNDVVIPTNSIRFRIIANSNSLDDQIIKNKIKDDLKENIIPDILSSTNIYDSREIINNSIPIIRDRLDRYNVDYDINYGNNYFPSKRYNGVTYKEGNYESLVITLGKGVGNNFWCVLYPPLCLVEDNYSDNIEYKSVIGEILDKYNI